MLPRSIYHVLHSHPQGHGIEHVVIELFFPPAVGGKKWRQFRTETSDAASWIFAFKKFPESSQLSTVINYALPNATNVKLEVYDALGGEVKTLVDERQTAGNHEVTFNAGSLPSGGYIFGWRRKVLFPQRN